MMTQYPINCRCVRFQANNNSHVSSERHIYISAIVLLANNLTLLPLEYDASYYGDYDLYGFVKWLQIFKLKTYFCWQLGFLYLLNDRRLVSWQFYVVLFE